MLIAALGTVGVTLGVASGLATEVRAGENRLAVAAGRVDPRGVLIAGIGSRMVFAFALHLLASRAPLSHRVHLGR